MKHRVLFGVYYVGAPLVIMIRLIQQFFFIDQTNGFFKPELAAVGKCLNYICFAVFAAVIVTAAVTVKERSEFPKSSMAMCVVSVAAAPMMIISGLLEAFNSNPFIGILGVVCAIAFAWYAFGTGVNGPFPSVIMISAPVYAIARLISVFMSYRGEANYTFSAFNLLTIASIVLFSMMFAKIVSGVSSKGITRTFYIIAMLCSILCFSQGLIPVVAKIFSVTLHGTPAVELSYFAFGLLSLTAVNVADIKRK